MVQRTWDSGGRNAWEKSVPMHHVTSLLAGFHREVDKDIPGGALTPEMFDAWWNAVEERDWQTTVSELEWLLEFLHPVEVWLHRRGRAGNKPPMVKKLAAHALKNAASIDGLRLRGEQK